MNQLPLDFQAAKAARDRGMRQAAEHADHLDDTFADRAYDFLAHYARTHETFISEDATGAAAGKGITSPADQRAWGQVFRRAARDGLIERIGYGTSMRRHLSPTPLWRSLFFSGSAA